MWARDLSLQSRYNSTLESALAGYVLPAEWESDMAGEPLRADISVADSLR